MMKQLLFLACLIAVNIAYADTSKSEWNATLLTDKTIQQIQQAQYQYKKCVVAKMQRIGDRQIAVKSATATIIKQCESVLSAMRQVYLKVAVPTIITDRHLKKMRTDTTRRVLKQLMLVAAHKSAK